MIDHYVPQQDKDAGGRMAHHYIRLFVELGFHVSFLPANFERVEPYTDCLQQLGVNVMYSESEATIDDWIRENAIYIDYACVFRPSIAPRYVDQIRRYGRATKLILLPDRPSLPARASPLRGDRRPERACPVAPLAGGRIDALPRNPTPSTS